MCTGWGTTHAKVDGGNVVLWREREGDSAERVIVVA